jgi:hypothetical protein
MNWEVASAGRGDRLERVRNAAEDEREKGIKNCGI